jgi:hypothetical protein
MTPKELWQFYMSSANDNVLEAIEMMASDLVATSERVEALSRTGYFRAGQPTRAINLPVRERREPLDVPTEQAPDR